MSHELCQSFSLRPRRSKPWIWITKPYKSGIKKFVGRRRATTRTLPVERPAKNELCRAILFSGHSLEPMVDQRGLPDPSPGNDGNDVGILVCPGIVQKSDVLLPTKQIASGNR